MKTIFPRGDHKIPAIFCLLIALTGFAQMPVKGQQNIYNISGSASTGQVIPPVTGGGAGAIMGTYNQGTKILDFYSTWNNLTGAPTTANFYLGAAGANGPVLGEAWPLGTNNKMEGHTAGSMVLTASQEKDLLAGKWYFIYSTPANTTGEIRGQITAIQK
jgi:hypothetical protein